MSKKLTFFVMLGFMLLLPAASSFGQAACGDVNYDGSVNVADMTYLIGLIIHNGPPPPDTVAANADLCNHADVGDIAYLVDYIFAGGPPPCSTGAANCVPNSGGMITVVFVDGEISPGVITAGVPITFYLRYTNTTGDTIEHISNGFRVYSPDGAQWTTTLVDTTGALNDTHFNIGNGVMTNTWSADGSGSDTIGVLGCSYPNPPSGMPGGFDGVPITITIGPIDPAYVGKTICLDSCFYGPAGSWKWQVDGQSHYAPYWGGPHCFTIQEPTLVATPDTLNFWVYQGSPYPVSGILHISEASGYNIPFLIYPDTDSFISLSNDTGTTPDDIIVWAHGYGMSPGTYQNIILIDAEASNTPLSVVVNMTVYADPEGAMVLDNVTGQYGTTGIKGGVPVTFTMRAINNSGYDILGLTNGYQVYSPDGAQWDTLTADSFSSFASMFDLGFFIDRIDVDGSGADTIGFGGVAIYETGMPDGYDDLAYSITIGPIDSSYDGQ
ncbi:MAG: hypothetical protein ACE5K8_10455, partial [Candidatus Zixiibacteriota bacterium]